MRNWVFLILPVFICLGSIVHAFDAGDRNEFETEVVARPLTLQACWDIALSQNPNLTASQKRVLAAQENLGVVSAVNYPDLTFISNYSRYRFTFYLPKVLNFIPKFLANPLTVIGPQTDWNMYFRSRYSIYDGGRSQAQIQGSKALINAVEEDAEQVRQQIKLNVALAFYGLMSDQKLYEVAVKNYARMETHVALSTQRKNVGDAPLNDVLQVKVAAGNAQQFLVRSDSTIQMAKGDLNIAMGLPVDNAVEIIATQDEIYADPNEIDLQMSLDKSVCQRPEILASLERLKVSLSHIKEAKSAFMPQMYAEGYYGWRDAFFVPKRKNWGIGVTVEMPLFQGFGDYHQVKETEAEYLRASANHESLVQKIRQDVWNAFYQLKEAFEGIRQANFQIVDAKENLRMAEERYRVGAGTIKDMLDAEVGLAQTEASLVQAQWTYRSNFELFLWTQGFCSH